MPSRIDGLPDAASSSSAERFTPERRRSDRSQVPDCARGRVARPRAWSNTTHAALTLLSAWFGPPPPPLDGCRRARGVALHWRRASGLVSVPLRWLSPVRDQSTGARADCSARAPVLESALRHRRLRSTMPWSSTRAPARFTSCSKAATSRRRDSLAAWCRSRCVRCCCRRRSPIRVLACGGFDELEPQPRRRRGAAGGQGAADPRALCRLADDARSDLDAAHRRPDGATPTPSQPRSRMFAAPTCDRSSRNACARMPCSTIRSTACRASLARRASSRRR